MAARERPTRRLLARYARAQARLEARGGYLWRDRADGDGARPGVLEEDLDRALDTFSGGQLTRASLARALATGADVLLLDEPTNHLDIESLEWLEQTLVELDAAVVLVAHDRWFLEAVGTAVLEIEARPLALLRRDLAPLAPRAGGPRDRAGQGDRLPAGRDRTRMERFIERFRYKATKARQAQSRVKRLAKIERIEPGATAGQGRQGPGVQLLLAGALRTGDLRAAGRRASRSAGATRARPAQRPGSPPGGRGQAGALRSCCSKHAELWLERGEHVSLVGPNGSGKTTLIETLAGRRELAAGQAEHRPQRADRLPLPARRGARRRGPSRPERAGGGAARHRLDAGTGARAARALPVLRRGCREAAGRALRRRAPAPVAGDPRGLGGAAERADPGRAHEPSRHRESRGAGGCAALLRGGDPARLPRPRAARRGGHAHDRRRGRLAAQLPRRLAGVRARARGAHRRLRRRRARRQCSRTWRPPHARGPSARSRAPSRRLRSMPAKGARADAAAAKAQKPKPRAGRKGPSKNRLADQQKAERAVEEAEAAMRALEEELADPAAWATQYEAAKSQARHTAARRAVRGRLRRLEALID